MNGPAIHRWRRLTTLVGILLICTGTTTSNRSCSLGSSGNSGDGGDDPTFVATLRVQDIQGNTTNSFSRGESVQMILTVRNRRDTTQTIAFTDSRAADFVVVRENGSTVVWQLSKESAAPSPTPRTLEFAPGQILTFTTTWNQTDSASDSQVGTGNYEARGVLVFSGFDSNPLRASQQGSPLERFTIN